MKLLLVSYLLMTLVISLCPATACTGTKICNSNGFCIQSVQPQLTGNNMSEGALAGFALLWIFVVGIIYTLGVVFICWMFKNRRKQRHVDQHGIQMSNIPAPVRQNTLEMDIDDARNRQHEMFDSQQSHQQTIQSAVGQSRRRRQYTEAQLRVDTDYLPQ